MQNLINRVPYKYWVATVFTFGLFMTLMDSTVVNVAIPDLSREFHARTSSVEWTVTGYLLSLAVCIPAAGFLSDRFGTKRLMLGSIGVFVAASALCGTAGSLEQLVIFRLLQGVGGGVMTPVGTAMLGRAFPGAERAKASAIVSVPVMLAPMVGPVIGGYLVEYVSWRWIFFVNVPVGIVGLLIGLKTLEEHREAYAAKGFDVWGFITGSGSAALVLYALSQAATHGWTSGIVLGCGLSGLALGVAFVLIETKFWPPLIDMSLFKQHLFAIGNTSLVMTFAVSTGFLFILTLFLQELQGRSPLEAGLIQAPSAISSAIFMPIAGRLYPRIGAKRMLMIGAPLGILAYVPFLFVQMDTPAWVTAIILLGRGGPFALVMVASQTIIYGPLDSSKQGPASSAYNMVRQVAASFGVALIATVQIARMNAHLPSSIPTAQLTDPTNPIVRKAAEAGYHDVFILIVLMSALPFLAALLLKGHVADAALQTRPEQPGADRIAPSSSPALGE